MQKNILVVDDDKLVLQTVKNLLNKSKYNVVAINNVQSAIEEIKVNNFDLVITDIRMPEMTGLELIKSIKKIQSKYKKNQSEFMVITGYADDDAPKEALQLGIGEFMVKPFDTKLFLKTVNNYLMSNVTEEKDKQELGKKATIELKQNEFIYEKRIFLKETNLMGNTYFANYVLWEGEAREAALMSHPKFREEMAKNQHIKMITHSVYHRFIQETTFGDHIQIKVNTREIKKCSFVLVFRHYNKETGSILGEGWQRVAFADITTGSFCSIPNFLKELALSIREDNN